MLLKSDLDVQWTRLKVTSENSSFRTQQTDCQRIYHVGYTSSHLNTEVNQHWAWIILGWETLQGISGSAGTYSGQSTVFSDSLCFNQVIETRWNKKNWLLPKGSLSNSLYDVFLNKKVISVNSSHVLWLQGWVHHVAGQACSLGRRVGYKHRQAELHLAKQ